MTVVVIGVGNDSRGDDAAGLEVARCVRQRRRLAVRTCSGDALELLELWQGASAAVVVDGVRSNSPPGTIHRLDASSGPLPETLRGASTHSFGVAGAIELARALWRLPESVIVYGVEGCRFGREPGLSPAVAAAIEPLTRSVLEEAGRLTTAPVRARAGRRRSMTRSTSR